MNAGDMPNYAIFVHSLKSDAKYLGLNSDKVLDEFNNFLFQHTSKIWNFKSEQY